MKFRYILLWVLSLCVISTLKADDVKTVEGEYTLTGDGRLSPAECKRIAADNARIEALRKEFGTTVSQDLLQSDIMHGDKQKSHFMSLSLSEVKGEWLGDLGEPQFTTSLDANDNIVVHAKVKGRAKQITNQAADFDAIVLRNSTDKRNGSTHFVNGDDMYLYFSAPLNGYVSVYLAEESGEVYCLLPYSTGDVDEIRTKKGYEYIFFDSKRGGNDFGVVDELRLTAPDYAEYNKVYVLFSPQPFSPAPVKFRVPGAPPSISTDDFNTWLLRTRRNDPRMGVKSMNILITPTPTSSDRY